MRPTIEQIDHQNSVQIRLGLSHWERPRSLANLIIFLLSQQNRFQKIRHRHKSFNDIGRYVEQVIC